ncbi:MAG TPA: amino acid ABC transporter substrate-binding protein [Candidatus Limnocylindria bacterium]|nr:amino acid ABC transporter substrate-binding protein [Candidatus Limnocylindria bacterium]
MRRLAVVALVAAFVIAACGGSGAGGGNASGSAAVTVNVPDTVHLAAALPLTGADSSIAKIMKDSYELYFKQLNDAGGLQVGTKKVKFDLKIEDNKGDAAVSGQLYEKFITQDNVDLLLGGYNTTIVTQEVKVANRYKIPYVGGGGASSSIYVDNVWAVGVLASIEKLAATQLEFIKTQQDANKLPKPLKIAVAYENSSHGKEFLKGIQDGEKAAPDRFKVVFNETFDLNGKDYTSLLNKVKDANADAYMIDARVADYITMQTQYKQLGMYHQYLTYGPRGPEKAARDALKDSSDYITAATWFDSLMPGDNIKKWLDTFKATGDSPEWYAASAWECARILTGAIQKTLSVDKQKIHDILFSTSWDGSLFPSGTIKFDKTGQANNDYVMTQNTPNGARILIWPKEIQTAAATMPIPKK